MDIIKIGKEIEQLEEAETSWGNLERLAMLYIVHDRLSGEGTQIYAQVVTDVMPECGIGEFEEACTGKPILPIVDILSEHLAVIKALHPKEYRAVIERIKDIS